MFEMAYDNGPHGGTTCRITEKETARQLIERSASLTAASLAGTIAVLVETIGALSICITAEGGLFYAHPRYKKTVETTLNKLMHAMNMGRVIISIRSVPHANLLGCTIAGLSPNMHDMQ